VQEVGRGDVDDINCGIRDEGRQSAMLFSKPNRAPAAAANSGVASAIQ
jgi:hypothetical protein